MMKHKLGLLCALLLLAGGRPLAVQNSNAPPSAVSIEINNQSHSVGGVRKGALPFAIGGILLGLLGAIGVKRINERIYIAADVKRAVRFAPLAVLPDFNEVPDFVAAEHLKRLAVALEYAGRKNNLQRCIFAGISRGTGVTTVAESAKQIINEMRGTAVILDANRYEKNSAHLQAGSAALFKAADAGAEHVPENLVFVDAAPLMLSGETENFASAGAQVIVVIESGVTTRAQLVAAVDKLRKFEVGAVGFVLNRVSLAKADPAFRQSLLDMEKQLRAQGASSSTWPVKWHGLVNERVPVPEFSAENAELPGSSQTATDVPADKRPTQLNAPVSNEADRPWWMPAPTHTKSAQEEACVKAPSYSESAAASSGRIQPPKLPDWFWDSNSSGPDDFTQLRTAANVAESPIVNSESRIERLRGLLANVGLADLHRSRAPIAGSPQMIPHRDKTPDTIWRAGTEPVFDIPAEAQTALSDVAVSATAVSANVEAKPATVAPLEFVSAKDSKSDPSRNAMKEPAKPSTIKPPFSTTAAFDNGDDLQILPARRGQYGSR